MDPDSTWGAVSGSVPRGVMLVIGAMTEALVEAMTATRIMPMGKDDLMLSCFC